MPELHCLMLTSFNDDEALFDAIMAGASGYVLKEVRGADLIESVRRVAAGQSLLDPMVDGTRARTAAQPAARRAHRLAAPQERRSSATSPTA